MKEITGIIKRWWVALIFGIIAIGLGVYMLFNPIETYVTLSYVFAIYFIAYGIYKSYVTYQDREEIPAWGWSFALGIFTALLGCYLFLPGMATGTFVYFCTFSILFMGINSCAASFTLKDVGDPYWGWTLAIGILTILLSFVMLAMPAFSVELISTWFAIMFIVFGVQACVLSYRLSVANSARKKLENEKLASR